VGDEFVLSSTDECDTVCHLFLNEPHEPLVGSEWSGSLGGLLLYHMYDMWL
jgi:hypothetical protein